jgi:hypothetical protein
MISIENNEKGLEIMKSTSKYYPEIIILHEWDYVIKYPHKSNL